MNIPNNIEELTQFLDIKEELDNKVLHIAKISSKNTIYDHLANWFIENEEVCVTTESWWSDGTYDTEDSSFPVKYLFMSEDDIRTAIQQEKEEVEKQKERVKALLKAKAERIAEEKDKAEYERLKKKYGE